jgi:hypothetical protein
VFASIRRYRVHKGTIADLAGRVDSDFAEQISARPGFASYEFIDCGEGRLMTVSLFGETEQADASSQLAQSWTEANLQDFEFTRDEALSGELTVSRANEHMLEPGHTGSGRRFASVRRYSLRSGEMSDLMHTVDTTFADDIAETEGFEAYHVLDCGRGELLSISLFRDQAGAEASDEKALKFVQEELAGKFELERTEVVGGEVMCSRAMARVLEPAHA